MKIRILDELIISAKNENLNILNIVVRQNGEIIDRHDFEEEKPVLLWSVSKTFTSMAVGIAISENYFKLDDHIIDFFPEFLDKSRNEYVKKLTVHDLLCMGTGHAECPIVKADWSNGKEWDITELFFQEPFVYEPGTHYVYDNSAAYILSRIISITTGNDLDEYLNKKIFEPLEIPKPQWDRCPKGVIQGFSGLHLKAEELSRFGQLILDKGVWNNKQLIPRDFIEKATSVQIKTDDFNPFYATDDHHQGYGYQIWRNSYPNSYRMDGSRGQYVVIIPDKNAVITFVSNEPKNMSGILALTWSTLVDKL